MHFIDNNYFAKERRKNIKKRFIVALLMMLMFGMFLVPTKTAAKTVTTKSYIGPDKNLDSVKRGKTYTVKIGYESGATYRLDNGWLLFKAPKTKVYTFTVSDLKSKSGKRTFGHVIVEDKFTQEYYLKSKGCSSKKNVRLRVGSKFIKGTKKYGDYLKKRSGKTLGKIEKGTKLYIGFHLFHEGDKLKLRID